MVVAIFQFLLRRFLNFRPTKNDPIEGSVNNRKTKCNKLNHGEPKCGGENVDESGGERG